MVFYRVMWLISPWKILSGPVQEARGIKWMTVGAECNENAHMPYLSRVDGVGNSLNKFYLDQWPTPITLTYDLRPWPWHFCLSSWPWPSWTWHQTRQTREVNMRQSVPDSSSKVKSWSAVLGLKMNVTKLDCWIKVESWIFFLSTCIHVYVFKRYWHHCWWLSCYVLCSHSWVGPVYTFNFMGPLEIKLASPMPEHLKPPQFKKYTYFCCITWAGMQS